MAVVQHNQVDPPNIPYTSLAIKEQSYHIPPNSWDLPVTRAHGSLGKTTLHAAKDSCKAWKGSSTGYIYIVRIYILSYVYLQNYAF